MRPAMKKLLLALGLALLALAAYLALWPVPVQPVAWVAPPAPGYTGVHAVNTRLAGLRSIALGGEEGPEHIVLGRDGQLYAAVASGRILRMQPDGSGQQVFADTGGRVLGFDFDAAGQPDRRRCLQGPAVHQRRRQDTTVLADRVGGDPIRYADAVVVAPNGKIYLTDASTRFAPAQWGGTFEASVLDILEQAGHRPRPRTRPRHRAARAWWRAA